MEVAAATNDEDVMRQSLVLSKFYFCYSFCLLLGICHCSFLLPQLKWLDTAKVRTVSTEIVPFFEL